MLPEFSEFTIAHIREEDSRKTMEMEAGSGRRSSGQKQAARRNPAEKKRVTGKKSKQRLGILNPTVIKERAATT